MMKPSKLLALVAISTAALALTGCTGAAPGAANAGSDANQIRYLIGQPENPADLDLVKADIKSFEQESGIKVKLDVMPNDNLRTVLQTQLRSGEGPDVFGYDTGPGFAGALAKAGLLYDLTDAYSSRHWNIYDFAKKRVTFDGKIVGIPDQIEEVGLFYNKDIFAKLGLQEPRNLSDLAAAAATIAKAGIIPLAVSDKEGWQGGHLLSMALSSRVGSEGMSSLIDGKESWSSPDVVAALKVWDQFRANSYLTPSPAAVTYDNANALFYSGKAAMNPTGSWLVKDIEANAKFDVGFIPFPAESGPGIFSGGLGSGVFVSAKSKKIDAALKFLDYGHTADHGRWQVEKLHTIPAYPVDTKGVEASKLFSQVLEGTAQIAAGTGDFGYNIDVLTTDVFNKAMWDGFQGILTGQKSPDQVAQSMDSAFKSSAK
jgi:raffinose/stachyose/melibiose transport system substrate-binding protein